MEYPSHHPQSNDLPAKPQGFGTAAATNSVSLEGSVQQFPRRRGIPEFSELVLACRHRLMVTLCLGVSVSTALVALSVWLVDAPFEAVSLVQVRQNQEVVFTPQASRSEDAAFVRAQEQMVLSPQVLDAALSGADVQTLTRYLPKYDAPKWLKNLLHIDIQAGAEVMSISVRHPSPQVAQTLCDAVTRAYLEIIAERSATDRQRKQTELERATREADKQLDALWAELNQVASEVGSDSSQSLTIRDEIQLQAYREYAQQLRTAQLRGNELQSQLTEERLRLAIEEQAFDESTDAPLQDHPDVIAARGRIAAMDAKIEQVREVAARDDSPKLTRLIEDRASYVAELENRMNELRPQLLEKSREQHRIKMESGLVQLQKQLEHNQAEKEYLLSRMEEIDTTIIRSDEKTGVQLEISRHAVDRQTRLADGLSKAMEEFRIESQSRPRVALIESAPLPSHANRGRQLKAATTAVGFGCMITILGVGYFELRSCRVRHSDDVRIQSVRPVFGAVENGLACGANEAAARLMLLNNGGKVFSSLMVSSASADEPRHLVALDVARAFRGFRCRTLLVDCDASGAYLSRQLGADHLTGLLQIGSDQSDPCRYIVPTSEEGLDFLPLGQTSETKPWIDPQSLSSVLQSVRAEYDLVVVNGPAIQPSAESLLLASRVDQTLLAVFKGTSRWNQLAASEQIAIQAGISVFGSVLRSDNRSVALSLRFGRQGESRRTSESGEATEESLRESVAAIQQEIQQCTTRRAELPTEPAAKKDCPL